MRTIERKQIDLALTDAHPLNREFLTTGKEWDEFEDDIAARGIREDLVVRWAPELNERYQVLRGHRRRAAGLRRKVKTVWALLVDCSDEEAFDHMWEGNLFREDINPADEARAVRAMMENFGKTEAELAAKWHRSLEWIRTRQGLLELGDEVLEAVARPGRERLTMGAVEEILKVPVDLRAEAVRMVLQPELELLPLDECAARMVLRECLLAPAAAAAAWEAARPKAVKVWRKELEGLCLPGMKGELMVSSKGVAEAAGMTRGYVDATERVPLAEVLPDAPAPGCGLRWVHLAVKHGLAVVVVPHGEPGEAAVVVNQRMMLDAEAAMAECGGGNWLVGKKSKGASVQFSGEEEDKRVAKAKADVEAGFDTGVDVSGKAETVIEQHVERCAMMRIGPVEELKAWAMRGIEGEEPAEEEWMPEWAKSASVYYEDIKKMCDWVLGLKV